MSCNKSCVVSQLLIVSILPKNGISHADGHLSYDISINRQLCHAIKAYVDMSSVIIDIGISSCHSSKELCTYA